MGKTSKRKEILQGADNYAVWLAKFDAAMRKDEKYDELLDHGPDLEQVWLQRKVARYDQIQARKEQMKASLALVTIDDADAPLEDGASDMTGAEPSGSDEEIEGATYRTLAEQDNKRKELERNQFIEDVCITLEAQVIKVNKDLYAEIIEVVSSTLVTKLSREAKNNGLECLKILDEKYAGEDSVKVKKLKAELMNMEPADHKNFIAFLEAIMAIYHELIALRKPPDTDCIQLSVQEHIPVSSSSIITVLGETNPDMPFETWMKRVEKHCLCVAQLKHKGEKSKKEKVAAKQAKVPEAPPPAASPPPAAPPPAAPNQLLCQICKQYGHAAWKCKFRYSTEGKNQNMGNNPFTRKCHHCGDTTHLVKDCPKKHASAIKQASSKDLKKAFKAASLREELVEKAKKKKKKKVAAKKSSSKKKKVTPAYILFFIIRGIRRE